VTTQVNHRATGTAGQIWSVFQESYRVEAGLLGVDSFPPLERPITAIRSSRNSFWCYLLDKRITGVVEVEEAPDAISICSLAVHPEFFRQGIASALISRVVNRASGAKLTVQTARLNHPAISLYKKFDFVETEVWTSKEGIELVALERITPRQSIPE